MISLWSLFDVTPPSSIIFSLIGRYSASLFFPVTANTLGPSYEDLNNLDPSIELFFIIGASIPWRGIIAASISEIPSLISLSVPGIEGAFPLPEELPEDELPLLSVKSENPFAAAVTASSICLFVNALSLASSILSLTHVEWIILNEPIVAVTILRTHAVSAIWKLFESISGWTVISGLPVRTTLSTILFPAIVLSRIKSFVNIIYSGGFPALVVANIL